jgi:arylsulfatase
MRILVHLFACALVSIPFATPAKPASEDSPPRPNIILIFTDDQGYNDLGCFGSKTIKTPNIDRMASEGLRLTNFYTQPVCGVSRAALMTGCYPIRVGEPNNIKRLHTVPHPDEVTMAEVLKSAGYATALIGKWHLGLNGKGPGGTDPATMPNAQGFDYFFGTPKFNGYTVFVDDTKFRSPILRNNEVVVQAVESWDNITGDYTRESIEWIRRHKDKPFFLYLAHNLPHIPVGASEDFKGKSEYGPYGDTIEEIDWSTGRILDELKALGIDDKTLVVFTSDNGPWVETTAGMKPDGRQFIPRDHSGSAEPLRGWKMSAWDGGCRVPFVARWPGRISGGRVSDEILSSMDLLPTFAELTGAKLPLERVLDGSDATSFLLGHKDASPRDDYLYYTGCLLTGIRVDQWKLVLPRPENPPGTGWWGRMIEAVKEVHLFDLNADPGENVNLASQHPEVVARLMKRIEAARENLGDINETGSGARFFDPGNRRLEQKRKQPSASPAKSAGYDKLPPKGSLRFRFEDGSSDGWKVTAGAFGTIVTDMPSLPRFQDRPFAREGGHHLSTLMTSTSVSDQQVGVIESPEFVIQGEEIAFLIGGGFDKNHLYLALVDSESDQLLMQSGGKGDPLLRRVIWSVSHLQDRRVRFRLVDNKTANWGHLNVDDISLEGRLLP